MTLDEWIDAEKERLDRFRSFYLENSESGFPTDWPIDMQGGDWDEQFRLWGEI